MIVGVDNKMEILETAAESQDEYRFVQEVKTVDWRSRPASDILRAIRLALEAGCVLRCARAFDTRSQVVPE